MPFRSVDSGSITSGTSVVRTCPSGVVTGDTLLFKIDLDYNNDTGSITWPSGFVPVVSQAAAASNQHRTAAAWKVATAGDVAGSTTYTATVPGDDGGVSSSLMAYSGRDTAFPVNGFSSVAVGSGGSPFAPGSLAFSTTVDGCDIVYGVGIDYSAGSTTDTRTWTVASGYTERLAIGTGVAWTSLEIGDKNQSTHGAVASLAPSLAFPTGTAAGQIIVIALKPPGGGISPIGNNTAAGLTVSLPSGYSAVATHVGVIQNLSYSTSIAITAPSGWSTLVQVNALGFIKGSIFYRVFDGSEGSSFTVGAGGGTNDYGTNLAIYSGVDNTTPFDVTAGTTNNAAGGTNPATWLSITTGNASDLLVAFFFGGNYHVTTPPTGFTSRVQGLASAITGTAGALDILDNIQDTAGASGNKTGTTSTTSDWLTIFAALKPASAPAGGVSDVPWASSQRIARNTLLRMSPRSKAWRQEPGSRVYSLPSSL